MEMRLLCIADPSIYCDMYITNVDVAMKHPAALIFIPNPVNSDRRAREVQSLVGLILHRITFDRSEPHL